ncbi:MULTISPECIES: methylated-DNA--[protein]-cysteine S-methyltransferase [Eubacterium]|uniref:Methylated-DNA--protein-cysteine methyltransferase n=1 Tax=Eubacterium barkeri TaxID=1528 RepID=A0A1H3F543_EUBBA|nr:methylated-DNA--[protein]-cysteine S-methyltransferase [Eubacterium barkeri]SDX86111.1 methylated-DNA-[protein]-cysteine S-methyltransferase [Eubacterium barkeri]
MFDEWSHYSYETPLGTLTIQDDGIGIARVHWDVEEKNKKGENQETELIKRAFNQLMEYFGGSRKTFDLPLRLRGTAFQKKVWQVLRQIPYGETWTYQQVADAIGNSNASRAVGMANNRNPVAIIVPCHRVIGSNGRLTGYAGGIELKKQLLQMESVV